MDQSAVCPGQVLTWKGTTMAESAVTRLPQEGSEAAPEPREESEYEDRGESPDYARKAREWYLRKREPSPGAGVSMEDYLAALEHMRGMRQYSTALGRFLPPRSEGALLANAGPWRSLGPGNIGGRTRSLVIDPDNPDIMYAGAVAGGVWKTYDGGQHWAPLDDLMANLAVTCLILDPANSPACRRPIAPQASARGAPPGRLATLGTHEARS